ncbi:hypothetical protein QBC44DRAFT_325139 [Cladorrhinum sp. PSN332]|nr:hypothetical protein QBC44DRAFT_325139 [Cladorrhinum sp. PSN332]
MTDAEVNAEVAELPGFLKARWPVLLPSQQELSFDDEAFAKFLRDTVKPVKFANAPVKSETTDDKPACDSDDAKDPQGTKFMEALLASTTISYTSPNQMLTENGDVAFKSSKNPLVDLFYELEESVSSSRLHDLLVAAWAEDPLATLKIIFNARSIHLGKSSRKVFYRCAGWLAEYHPLTLITALQWLSRPVIPKKVEKKEEEDEDMVVVDVADAQEEEEERTKFDVKNGVSHGYWKDMLNLLALAANEKLTVFSNPGEILNIPKGGASGASSSQADASSKRQLVRNKRTEQASRLLEEDPIYRGLHLTVARLFAEQLKADLALLKDGNAKARRRISLCGKWAPSSDRFHDKHTLVTSSIAELLYPEHMFAGSAVAMADRKTYLRHAREYYRKDVAALRKHLDIVERELSAKTLSNIKYDRVPSTAMNNYSKIFATKDGDRFNAYLKQVAEGKARISGATLLPSTIIKAVRDAELKCSYQSYSAGWKRSHDAQDVELTRQVANGQWKTLVQRIKDSGTMESAIAVCDVSGSMQTPVFKDGTCPMDSAIGLSLLVAEVTKPPFGGSFITFSEQPKVVTLDLSKPLHENCQSMSQAEWGMNTNFVSVFEKLILPMAIKAKVPPEDMVKRVFVFSDMQFDEAEKNDYARLESKMWSSSFERIQTAYKEAGYEMPELVFWNLAGGRAGYENYGTSSSDVAPKPVTADQDNVSLVSGYSQAMLKVFMDKGLFDDEDEKEEDVEMKEEEGAEDGDDGEEAVLVEKKKQKKDPLTTVKKAISHKAYEMLQVVD